MTNEQIIKKLKHLSVSINSVYGENILFNINGELAFVIKNSAQTQLQVYTMDLSLRVYFTIDLDEIFIENNILFLNKEKTSYLIL